MLPPLLNMPEVDFTLCGEKLVMEENAKVNKQNLDQMYLQINANCRSILAIADRHARARRLVEAAAVSNGIGNIYKVLIRRRCLPLERWKQFTRAYPMPISYPDWDFLIRLMLDYRGEYIEQTLSSYEITEDAPLMRYMTDASMQHADGHQLLLMALTVLADPLLAPLRATMTPAEIQHVINVAGQRFMQLATKRP
jgi:hypothetical protein